MDSERASVRNNLQVYQGGLFSKLGEFVSRFLLGCIKLTCYVLLKKGTIYVYDSKRSCLNNPQQPKLFFNLNVTKICRTGHFLRFEDPFTTLTLWSALEEEVSMLEQSANYNKKHLEVQKIFPKKFMELNSRIDEKINWEKPTS